MLVVLACWRIWWRIHVLILI